MQDGCDGKKPEAGSRKPITGRSPASSCCAWSADYIRLLFTDTRKVRRSNTRGDYWVLDRGNRRGGRRSATRTRFLSR
jgi:hypothetical protein